MKKFFLLDSLLIRKMWNVEITPGEVTKVDLNPLFKEEYFGNPQKLWEARYDNAYPNVFYDEEYSLFRCYYTLILVDPTSAEYPLEKRRGVQYYSKPGRITGLCYAESKDGFNWIKPNLGLVEFNGSYDNNIIKVFAHGSSVFKDLHETDPKRRYKMITRDDRMPRTLAYAFSENGINWTDMMPILNVGRSIAGDTYNFAFWDEESNKYIMISRTWDRELRVVARTESLDFINWSKPVEVYKGIGNDDQIYSMPVFKYEGLYFGLASIYHGGDVENNHYDKVDCELTYSGDTIHWDRVCMNKPFIPRGQGEYPDGAYDCGCIYSSIPVFYEDEIHFYYMGGNGQHTNFRETSLNLAILPKEHLAGVNPRDLNRSGFVQTNRMFIYNPKLYISVDILEDDGYVKLELADISGNVIKGYSFDECLGINKSGNDIEVLWNGESFNYLNNEIQIKVEIYKAKVYTISGDLHINLHP